jgi:hypothetical protein
MSNRWAAIVYGRSYHLDFRFITLPHDFTESNISWASQHIIATTQQARNLANFPRWSSFKNNDYCIVGVTCMVRDLIDTMTKDNRGRPLYVFVGYVTKLEGQAIAIPPYTGECLDRFKSLYQEIEQVWLVKDYERDSRHRLSQYQPLEFETEASNTSGDRMPLLNDRSKYPDKTYLYPSQTQQNKLLWLAFSQCPQATSICLNIKGKAFTNSPFLNQAIAQLAQFQIRERITALREYTTSSLAEITTPLTDPSFSQKISLRAREDIDLTLQQAAKVAIASQELLDNFTSWSNPSETLPEQLDAENTDEADEADSFGFKTKKSSSNQQDWF